jgi:AcrR family transcriptional regulator
MDPDARKGWVVDVALARLQATGFPLTTLADLARAANLDEADLRTLFGDEEGMMRELVSPLLERLREITASAATIDLRQGAQVREVVERYLDALVAHRPLAGVVLGDPTASSSEAVRLVRAEIQGLREELAGGSGGDLDQRIRAASALGAVHAAVLEFADFEPTTVRDVITDAAVAIILS